MAATKKSTRLGAPRRMCSSLSLLSKLVESLCRRLLRRRLVFVAAAAAADWIQLIQVNNSRPPILSPTTIIASSLLSCVLVCVCARRPHLHLHSHSSYSCCLLHHLRLLLFLFIVFIERAVTCIWTKTISHHTISMSSPPSTGTVRPSARLSVWSPARYLNAAARSARQRACRTCCCAPARTPMLTYASCSPTCSSRIFGSSK